MVAILALQIIRFVIAPLSRQRISWIQPMALASGSQGKSVNAGGRIMTGCAFHFSGLAIVSFTAVRNPIFTLSVMILRRALSGLNLRTLSTRINTISHFSEILRSLPSILSRKLFPLFPRSLKVLFDNGLFAFDNDCRIPHSPVFQHERDFL